MLPSALAVNERLSFPVPARGPAALSSPGRSLPGLRPRVASPRRPPAPPPVGPGGGAAAGAVLGPARRVAERSGRSMVRPGEENMDSNVLAIVVAASECAAGAPRRGRSPGFPAVPGRNRERSVRFL